MAAPATCTLCELHAEAVFRVEGMDCNEEVVILERRLKPLRGLEAISADLIGQRLHVKYDAARLNTSDIVDAVGDTGMRVWLEHEEPTSDAPGISSRRRLVLACAAATVAGFAAGAAGQPALGSAAFVLAALVGAVYPTRRAVAALRTGTLDINVLMVVAVAGAILLGDYSEAASVVLLFAVAQWLEARTLERARQAIRALLDLSPVEATRVSAGEHLRVPVETLQPGDRILVRPGDKVPLDGRVIRGGSDVNEAPITGESLPVDKASGDAVYAGTINGRGALEIEVTRRRGDTRLSRIIHLVEAAQAQRAPVQSFVDRFARIYTPIVIALALAVAIIPPLAGAGPAADWAYRGLVLLVIACPCALVISTPVSIVAALSGAARNGVLIKGGAHLERLAAVKVVAFDKTGTLTHGELRVAGAVGYGVELPEVLAAAAAVEVHSEHPIARAIVEYARAHGAPARPATDFLSHPGLGAEGRVAGRQVLVGNARLMSGMGVDVTAAERLGSAHRTQVYVAIDGRLAGVITVADRTRQTAAETVSLLRSHGIARIVMLTGDHEQAAKSVAADAGMDGYDAGLLPEQKHTAIVRLRTAHGPVLMVGDGVNDAPALAAADVGAAMGAAGSDVALETADVALMSDELLKLPYAIRLARATVRNIRVNVAISLVLKAAFLLMAVGGAATLWMAVLADTGASVIVVANALRLLRAR